MAFSKTPMQDTDQTKTLPMMMQWQTRDVSDTKDTQAVNVVWDIIEDPNGTYAVAIKREGLTPVALSINVPSAIYGVYFWQFDLGRIVIVGAFGALMFDAETGLQISSGPPNTFADALIGFTEFQYDTGQVDLIITDGNKIVRLGVTGIVTEMLDVDIPRPHNPYPVYLDGYLFLSDDKSIANSNLNDPNTWVASNFISVDAYPDDLLAIARHGVYIVAFGGQSIQYYYDAANPTGTPLALYSASAPQIGFQGGLVTLGETLLFTGNERNGNPGVYILRGLKLETLTIPSVARRLDKFTKDATSFRTGHLISCHGHMLYTWTDYSTVTVQELTSVYAVDLGNKLWVKLKYQDRDTFPLRSTTLVLNRNTYRTFAAMTEQTSRLLQFSDTIYADVEANFDVQFTTKNWDFDTQRTKFGSKLMVNTDQTTVPSSLYVSWTDNDYQSWSPERPIDLSNNYKQLFSMGMFRKRAFRFRYRDNQPMRFVSAELDYQQGTG